MSGLTFLGAWQLFGALMLLVYLTKSRLWGNSNRGDSLSTSTLKSPDDDLGNRRNFVQEMERNHKKCIIFFGSQTGTAEGYAGLLAKEGKGRFGLETMVANLEDYDIKHLSAVSSDKIVIFVLATYGEGEPTDNAADFYDFIVDEDPAFENGTTLDDLRYSAFGLGNRTYEHYNYVVRRVSQRLDALGATRIGDVGEGDDGSGTTEEDFLSWKETVWKQLASAMGLEELDTVSFYQPSFVVSERHDISSASGEVYLGEPNKSHLDSDEFSSVPGPFDAHNPSISPVVASRSLLSPGVKDRNCIHLDVDISNTGLSYATGDHIAIWPSNTNEEVDTFLNTFGLAAKRHWVIDISAIDSGNKIPFPTPTTYDTVARYYLEICGPVRRQLAANIAPFAPTDEIQERLRTLTSDPDMFHSKTHYSNLARFLTWVGNDDKTDTRPLWSCVPLSLLLEQLPRLQPRYYSIASSPRVQPNTVSIAVAVKAEVIPGRVDPRPFCGVASNLLLAIHRGRDYKHLKDADHGNGNLGFSYDIQGPRKRYSGHRLPIHIRASHFKLPKQTTRPIIMIGPGTGAAPFRGFVQERAQVAQQGEEIGLMMFFFGCRKADEDFIYEEEWKVIFPKDLYQAALT